MPNSHEFIIGVNQLLAKLDESGDLVTGIEIANKIIRLLGIQETKEADIVVDEQVLQLPNAERYDHWFQNHPWMGGERAAFEITNAKDMPIQAKFYWLKKRSRQFIAGGVHFTENWEDADYTHNDNFKVGVDFFLSPNGKSLLVALSNRGNIRVVELQHKLNNTQLDIFTKWRDANQISSIEALHSTLWNSFKLQSVNKDFYTGVSNSFTELLQHLKSVGRDEEDAKLFASRLIGRLLFVWFLRKKDIIDESLGYFDASSADATSYYRRSLERLFFNTLNTPIDDRDEFKKEIQKRLFPETKSEPQAKLFQIDHKTPYLNGGLFEPHDNDWYKDFNLTFPEGFFTGLYDHFDQFNFTTDESSPEYEQVAIDPEMLGRVFESLLATQVDETGQQAHKAKGAFYTPREIVSYMCRESLRNYLYEVNDSNERFKKSIDELLDRSDHEWAGAGTNSRRDAVPKEYRITIIDALDTVTVLDPACGSGAFPMGMLQLLIKTYERIEGRFDPYKTKLQIVQNNIFGVDIEPMAVEISRLRAWLSLIVDEEDSQTVAPLPNLDFKFVCANSLIPLDKELGMFSDGELHQKLKDIRMKYFNARSPKVKKKLQADYRALTNSNQQSFTDDLRTRQLKSFDPFKNSHPSDFFDPDQMFGMDVGFSIVIGNPPYGAKYSVRDKNIFKNTYRVTKTARGIKGSLDTYALFIELGHKSLKKNGNLNYILPISVTTSDAMGQTHALLEETCEKITFSSYSVRPKPVFENAMVNTSILFFVKTNTPNQKVYSTKMYRKSEHIDIQEIVEGLNFQEVSKLKIRGRYPKISDDIEIDILNKLNSIPIKIRDLKVPDGRSIYYRAAGGRYFKVITNYTTNSSAEKSLILRSDIANTVGAILSTSLFFWYYQVFSDNLNLKAYEIESFPIPIEAINETVIRSSDALYDKYLKDIEKNANVRLTKKYAHIDEFREYKIGKSFSIIDELDDELDKLFGLNATEIDYIKTYDKNFRVEADD